MSICVHLWPIHSDSEQVIQQFVWGQSYIDELVQIGLNDDPMDATEQDIETTHYAFSNANYNVQGLVDENGAMVERYEYTPYGERQVYISAGINDPDCYALIKKSQRAQSVGGLAQPWGLNPVGHQGLFHDQETGLANNRRRILHSRMNRFIQRDPLGYVDGMNGYEYVKGAPINRIDPEGTFSKTFIANWRARKFAQKGKISIHMSSMGNHKGTHPSSSVEIRWYPPDEWKDQKDECCTEVKFSQIIDTSDYDAWGADEYIRFKPDGGFWYAYQKPWVPGLRFAELEDRPGGDLGWTYNITQAFVTVAICAKGQEAGYVYGVIVWGHVFKQITPPDATRYDGSRFAQHADESKQIHGLVNFHPKDLRRLGKSALRSLNLKKGGGFSLTEKGYGVLDPLVK